MELWSYWKISPYDWSEYFWSTYMKNLEKFWADFNYTTANSGSWLELTLKKWRDAFETTGTHSISRGYEEMAKNISRTMRNQINEALDKKRKYAEDLAKKSNPSQPDCVERVSGKP